MKKVLALVLALLMVFPILVACGPSGEGGTATTTGNGTTSATPDSSTTAPDPGVTQTPVATTTTGGQVIPETPKVEVAEIPEDAYYSGVTFNVLSRMGTVSNQWGNYDIMYNGESELVVTEIANAIKKRNESLYDRLGVDVNQVQGAYNEASTALQTNSNEYDMFLLRAHESYKLAQTGKLYATSELEYLDTSKPWYDQNSVNDLKIKGKLYYFFSDITCLDEDATWVFFFNHKIIQSRGLEDPYDLFAKKKWTIDKFIEMAEAATDDPSSTDPNGAWGVLAHQYLGTSLFTGAGEKVAVADGSGFKLTMDSGNIIEIMEKAISLRPYWIGISINSYTTTGSRVLAEDANSPEFLETYSGGNVLFMPEVLVQSRDLYNLDIEMHIGILAPPMYNDQQSRYYTPVNNVATVVCLPKGAPENAERTSVIFEFWAAESHRILRPAYYDQAQKSRFAKDDITPALLDEIFESRTYDVGQAYSWNDLYLRFEALIYDGNKDFASMYKRYAGSAELLIKQQLKKFPD